MRSIISWFPMGTDHSPDSISKSVPLATDNRGCSVAIDLTNGRRLIVRLMVSSWHRISLLGWSLPRRQFGNRSTSQSRIGLEPGAAANIMSANTALVFAVSMVFVAYQLQRAARLLQGNLDERFMRCRYLWSHIITAVYNDWEHDDDRCWLNREIV